MSQRRMAGINRRWVRALCTISLVLPRVENGSAAPALINLSTLGPAGGGANLLYGGFVISGGSKTLVLRGVGPALAGFGVSSPLPDPTLTVFNASGATLAANDNWNSADAATFSSVGAFALPPGSGDAGMVQTLSPGAYTAQISASSNATATGPALFELYDDGGAGQLINLSTRLNLTAGATATAGFVISGGAGTRQLLIRAIGPGLAPFGVSPTVPSTRLTVIDSQQTTIASAAANGTDAVVAAASAHASAFTAAASDSALLVNVGPGAYTAQMSAASGSAGAAMIEVYDVTGWTPPSTATTAYIARLAPSAAAAASLASGYASLEYDAAAGTVSITLQFGNLTGAETAAHLEIGSPGSGSIVTAVAPGTNTSTVPDLSAALSQGRLFIEIDSAAYPGGELTGTFAATTAASAFVAPATPPALPATLLSAPDAVAAARFLTQATFGPTLADISALSARGIPGWIDDQIALPPTLQLVATRADAQTFPNPTTGLPSGDNYFAVTPVNRSAAWWKIALTAPDQLRQRVALALSELMVASEQDTLLHAEPEALAHYYDLLVQDAFGNFRQLLTDVTYSPVMGTYLTYVGNQKTSLTHNNSPDENYAREVQQLFTIGLLQLQPDGTLALSATGAPIATFDQTEITNAARVFTGLAYGGAANFSDEPADTKPQGAADGSGWLVPMIAWDSDHDTAAKNVIGGAVLPAGQTTAQDISGFLDLLFQHGNTGPMVARHLIQRLVTSNPSPGYVYRVASVFANDGTGTRGNLAAVVRAILTDYEARSADLLSAPNSGKIKEPLLRMTALFRALHASAPNGRYLDSYYNDPRFGYTPGSLLAIPEYFLGEGALAAPSVFNFFSPTYVVPGPLAAAGLVAPEMELADAHYTLNWANEVSYYFYRDPGTLAAPTGAPSPFLTLDLSDFLPLANDTSALLDRINLICCAGQMSPATRQGILNALAVLQPGTTAEEQVKTALQLTFTSPDGTRQK